MRASELSSSPRRGTNNIANWPVFGLYLPDAIHSYHVRETAYLVMANEGDTRDYPGFNEEIRVGAVAIENAVKTNPGFAQFFTTAGHY